MEQIEQNMDLAERRMRVINDILRLAKVEQKGSFLMTSKLSLGDLVICAGAPLLPKEEGWVCDYCKMRISIYDSKSQLEYIGNLNKLTKVLSWESTPAAFRFAPDRQAHTNPTVLRESTSLTAGDHNKFDEFLLGYIPKQIEDHHTI